MAVPERAPIKLHFIPAAVTGLAFLVLFAEPLQLLIKDWWREPDAGHGLLLGPLAVYLAWKRGLIDGPKAAPVLGALILIGAVVMRYASGLAAELFTMRMSMLAAAGALVVYKYGLRQIQHWWLPSTLLLLSVPLPTIVLNTLALPLQLQASQLGASLLEWRQVPVLLNGNIIQLPGQTLFVTEACSGLRSLTALLSLSILVGGLWLRSVAGRTAVVIAAIPIAIVLNGVRVFFTGFLVFFVSPEFGRGFMHYSEGWVIFLFAFAILGSLAWAVLSVERTLGTRYA